MTQRPLVPICLSFLTLAAISSLVSDLAIAQQNHDFVGEYVGALGPLHIKLHITAGPDGSLSANVDSPDQGLFALQCSDLTINGQALSFTVPNVRGEWTGVMSADHNTLTGVWKQGRPMALNLTRSSGTGSAPAASIQPAPTPAAAPDASRPSCTTPFGVSYWDGSAWQTMTIAAHLGSDRGVSLKDGLKNPFNRRAGITSIVTFKNPSAALALDPNRDFA